MNRIIGTYTGNEPGTLVFVFGAMHGNEPAGVEAMKILLKMLDVEPITNPDFSFRGKIVGLIGHASAFEQGKRFIERDLNRLWTLENVSQSFLDGGANPEFVEMQAIVKIIKEEIASYKPKKLLFLDIHTTSAQGGIFSIPANDEDSLKIAEKMHAPVVCHLLDGLQGTSLHYFNSENMELSTSAVCFEAGQHNDPFSTNRAIAAIIYALKAVECIDLKVINPQHLKILNDYSENLPRITDFFYRHAIKEGDDFMMENGFTNFQKIKKGTLLAKDKNGNILASEDCLILMPLYQKQGEDGFFLIK